MAKAKTETVNTEKMRKAAELLASGSTDDATAGQVGIAVRTLYRWKKLPEFGDMLARHITATNGKLAEAQQRGDEDAAAILKRAAAPAAKQIEKLITGAESEKVQLAAAQYVLDREIPRPKSADPAAGVGRINIDAEGLRALAAILREAKQVEFIDVAPVAPAQGA